MGRSRVVVLHGAVAVDAPPDEQDVLVQVASVSAALEALGHEVLAVPLSLRLDEARARLERMRPDRVFNLVEGLEGHSRLLHLGPALLDLLGLPYTGGSGDALYLTTHKVLAKGWLQAAGLPTPPWISLEEARALGAPPFPGPYLVKPVQEEGSIGLDDGAFVPDAATLSRDLDGHRARLAGRGAIFVERYVAGREFNLSLLEEAGAPRVLPPAEIRFWDYPPDKPRFLNYASKWAPDSFEYRHTERGFQFPPEDEPLLDRLAELAQACWRRCGARGYARVDFRVDDLGEPWILEINQNPCLSPDAGFPAAAEQAGLNYVEMIDHILTAAA